MIFDKEIYEAFNKNNTLTILKQNLYDYRYNQYKEEFNFLIGTCMLNMGYLHEAYLAFLKADTCDNSIIRDKLFIAVTLVKAQKYEEAQKYIEKNLQITELNQRELAVYIDISSRLNLNNDNALKIMINNYNNNKNDLDNIVFLIFGYAFNNKIKEAENLSLLLDVNKFDNIVYYLDLITEFYKLKFNQNIIEKIIQKINIFKLNDNTLVKKYLETIYAVNYYSNMIESKKSSLKQHVLNDVKNNKNLLVQLYCFDYDIAEKNNDINSMSIIINYIKNIKNFEDIEQALLYNVSYVLKSNQINKENLIDVKNMIEKLITLNPKNLKYRKYYFEFLISIGLIEQAKIITQATINLEKKEEKEEFELIKKFHSFYNNNDFCIFNHKNDKDCPLCFGTERMPIIKTIAFGHSPNEIFVDKFISKKIEVDEKTLKRIVDWQPMNVPSEIVGGYLQKLGAYTTSHDFPSVLVPGQTYLFIQLKNDAFKRLAKNGYSLNQIDPLYNMIKGINKYVLKNKIFNDEDKLIEYGNDNIVSANDFVIEIFKVTS